MRLVESIIKKTRTRHHLGTCGVNFLVTEYWNLAVEHQVPTG